MDYNRTDKLAKGKIPVEKIVISPRVLAYYRSQRRENFAASQRLEGIFTAVTERGSTVLTPSKGELRRIFMRRGNRTDGK